VLELIGRWWDDREYRRGHPLFETSDECSRLMVIDDEWFPTYIGTRAWCDGVRRDCALCGMRCCPCRHSDRPARMPS
jgi:hypothetical protein